jgi:NADH-quinone oxidoreductase subunit L
MELITWLIPLPPILAYLMIRTLFQRSRVAAHALALFGILASWGLSIIVVLHAVTTPNFAMRPIASSFDWLHVGETPFEIGVLVDPLSASLLFMVPLVCAMIFVYSVSYMKDDPDQGRFFAYVSLFAGAMLSLTVADNLLLLFITWEIMGACSYLLIGYWFKRKRAARAAIKAFIVTRIGDVLMLIGVIILYAETGTLSYSAILRDHHLLESLAQTVSVVPGFSVAALAGCLLFMGTVGKAAQFPLHVWLPDAMEGPTPISAMIHAATMVSAGVYMSIRMYPLYAAGGDPANGSYTVPLVLMAVTGAFTALFAALIASVQSDIKRVLAYSTVSQLGFMVAALGAGEYVPAMFHLMTHAFFKALLFMGAGAVIKSVERAEEEAIEAGEPPSQGYDEFGEPQAHFDTHNIFNMGGIGHKMRITYFTFLAGGMALAGLPLITSGFWSKDEIFLEDYYLAISQGLELAAFVFVMLTLAALLTGFYTARLISLVFRGHPRSRAAAQAEEAPPAMTWPLVILAIFAVSGGFIGVPSDFPVLLGDIFSPNGNQFHAFVGSTLTAPPVEPPFSLLAFAFSSMIAFLGLGFGFWVYRWHRERDTGNADPITRVLGPVYHWIESGFYLDQLYDFAIVRPVNGFARVVVAEFIDEGILNGTLGLIGRAADSAGDLLRRFNTDFIDGVGDGVPAGIGWLARWLRPIQNGRIQQYLFMVLAAIITIALVFLFTLVR